MEFAGHHAPMKNTDVIVLGAGIVGVSVALHLAARGDAGGPARSRRRDQLRQRRADRARQRDSLCLSRDLRSLLRYALNNRPDVRYHPLPAARRAWLARYWWHSAPSRLARAARAMLPLIERSVAEHDALKDEAGIAGLFRRTGWIDGARSQAGLDQPPPRPPRCRPTA